MNRALGFAALLAGLLAAAPGTLRAEGCVLRVGWEPYAVYTFLDKTGEVTGADIELIKAVAQEIGCELSFEELPWARILLEIERGMIDVTSSASRNAERDAYARFADPYREAEVAIYVRRGEGKSYHLPDLAAIAGSDFRLGTIAGYHYMPEFAALMKEADFAAQVDPAVDYATNLRKLLHGRIDGYLVDDVGVLVGEAKALGILDKIERHPLRFPGEALHLMFSKKSVDPEIVAAVNRALQRMSSDGRLKLIMDRFLQ